MRRTCSCLCYLGTFPVSGHMHGSPSGQACGLRGCFRRGSTWSATRGTGGFITMSLEARGCADASRQEWLAGTYARHTRLNASNWKYSCMPYAFQRAPIASRCLCAGAMGAMGQGIVHPWRFERHILTERSRRAGRVETRGILPRSKYPPHATHWPRRGKPGRTHEWQPWGGRGARCRAAQLQAPPPTR